jgi:putative protease
MPELVKSGISSFKIEGRMKSEYYIATVANDYRKTIDLI